MAPPLPPPEADPSILMQRLVEAAADPDANALLTTVGHWASRVLESDFVSLTSFEADTWIATRIYTTRPDEFPSGGRKSSNETWWTDWVMRGHNTFVANTAEELAEVFFDHQHLARLGFNAAVNLPVIFQGVVVGTINVFGPKGHFNVDRLAMLESLRLPGLVAFLAARGPDGPRKSDLR